MFFLGTQRLALFQKAMRGIQSLCKDLELDYKAYHYGVRPSAEHAGEANPVVRDPVVAQSKGAPKIGKKKCLGKRRRCTFCKGTGHTKRNCPAKGEHDEQHDLRDDAYEGDDLDMPDRVSYFICSVSSNLLSICIAIVHSWSQNWYNCKAKRGAHSTYQHASMTREAIS
ncbi:hypothetical protein AHAS_Ahas15G0261700 [Arachis hypogaea]